MPTISQLPIVEAVAATDQLPVSQDGVAKATSVSALLSGLQPVISVTEGALLGRHSLGPGGPEPVTVGTGLVMSKGTLQTTDAPLRVLDHGNDLERDDRVVVWNGSGLRTIPVAVLRAVHTAGRHISINQDGTISAVWPTAQDIGAATELDLAALPRATAVSAGDLLPLHRNGSLQAVTYDRLIGGITLDQAPTAAACQDSDSFWVGQDGPTLVRQSMSALWTWIASRLPEAHLSAVELSANTTLDRTVHNGRVLLCTSPLTLTPIIGNLGDGFHCEVINLSQGDVVLGSGIITASGQNVVAPRHCVQIRCFAYSGGIVVYAAEAGVTTQGPLLPPGAPTDVVATSVDSMSVTLSWTPPSTGSSPFSYSVRYRVPQAPSWTQAPGIWTTPTATIAGLAAGTAYELAVNAVNAAGASAASAPIVAQTISGTPLPGQVINVLAVGQDSSSIAVSWDAPTSGGIVASYTIQFRRQGVSVWSGNISGVTLQSHVVTGLTSGATYDLRVLASNPGGTGPASAVVSATTPATTGAVTSIQWNLAPSGPYAAGAGAIGMNVHVTPPSAAVRFGFSASASVRPTQWTSGIAVNTDLWGVYAPTPAAAGTWYAWAEGTDGSASTPWPTPFTVQ